ncbi:macroglobulin / complement [Anaeramoeba flamelloides]|uniref:Macroglobulin / complement n=1 Tax=Anaeramoeba flamelloides TaxID=1746091 RepID=A0AAV7YPV6_9EUKA|nr:macroglobulin / complement [Anaeramoeba flamelloides]
MSKVIDKHMKMLPIFFDLKRYSLHIMTDKQLYKPGENMYVRSILIESHKQKPLIFDKITDELQKQLAKPTFRVFQQNGSVVVDKVIPFKKQDSCCNQESFLFFKWKIPDITAGGEYYLEISYKDCYQIVKGRKDFIIKKFQVPLFKKTLTFLKNGYSIGDHVEAILQVEKKTGGYFEKGKVQVKAKVWVDEKLSKKMSLKLDKKGSCLIEFGLVQSSQKNKIDKAIIVCRIEVDQTIEMYTRAIPIIDNNVTANFYPEGGNLIENCNCTMYFETLNKNGDPMQMEGEIRYSKREKTDQKNKKMELNSLKTPIYVSTNKQGRGMFRLSNSIMNKTLFLVPREPKNLRNKEFKLPQPRQLKNEAIESQDENRKRTNPFCSTDNKADIDGFVLSCKKKVFQYGETICCQLQGCYLNKYRISLYKRELLIDEEIISFNDTKNEKSEKKEFLMPCSMSVDLDPGKYSGVLRITAYQIRDKKGTGIRKTKKLKQQILKRQRLNQVQNSNENETRNG